MKKVSFILFSIALLVIGSGFQANAANKTEKFKVYGNCGMCENRIEKAVKEVDGVVSADWDKETKMIEVVFNDTKTDIHKVNMAIADAGHDTDMHRAKDEVYNNLPGCCHYDRAPQKKMSMNNDEHKGCKEKGMEGKSCCDSKGMH